jgi:hypothetical protein
LLLLFVFFLLLLSLSFFCHSLFPYLYFESKLQVWGSSLFMYIIWQSTCSVFGVLIDVLLGLGFSVFEQILPGACNARVSELKQRRYVGCCSRVQTTKVKTRNHLTHLFHGHDWY